MIVIDKTCISDDIADKLFVCDLEKCKGACCVEGDLGAPLEEEELPILKRIYGQVKPYMSDAGKKAVKKQGFFVQDYEGAYSTPTIGNRECAYAIYDGNGILKCAIEQAYLDGKTDFKKPISCHLYPIRITKYEDYHAINYHRWQICSAACKLGDTLGVPVFKFLKEPLIRQYGEAWYKELTLLIEEKQNESAS
jgi:hypothetical protein